MNNFITKVMIDDRFQQDTLKDSDASDALQFSFEYLFSKDELKWVTLESDQVSFVCFSICAFLLTAIWFIYSACDINTLCII